MNGKDPEEEDSGRRLGEGEEEGDGFCTKEKDVQDEVEIEIEEEPNPPDGGYGWFVMIGMFLGMLLIGGLLKSSGLIFLQFQERFDTGALKAAWPGSLMATINNLVGPLVAAMCSRYSVRTSVMFGTAVLVLGLILNAFAEDFYFLFFCHSLLQGVGMGFVVTPGAIIVASYFERRRGFVNSLGSAGGSVGAFTIVPLVNFMFDYYGFQGTFLILAAIASHGFLIAFLYRPYSTHLKFSNTINKNENVTANTFNENGHADSTRIPLNEFPEDSAFMEHNVISLNDTSSSARTTNGEIDHYVFEKPSECHKRKKSCPILRSHVKICFPSEHSRKEKSKNRKTFHFNLLADVSYMLHLLSVVFLVIALKGTFMFIPAVCLEKGMTTTDAAMVLSISGAVDTVGRVVFGYVLDFPKLRPLRPFFYTGFLFCMCAAAFFIPFMQSFASMTIVCTVLGVAFGAYVSQRAVVLVDLMGKDLLPSCIGLLRLFQSIGVFTGPLLYGAIRDATESYDVAFYTGCGCLFVAGILMVLSIGVRHFHKKPKEDQTLGLTT